MRDRSIALLLTLACADPDPYADGGAWLTPAIQAGVDVNCRAPDPRFVGPDIGDRPRDFELLDQFAYRARLASFCRHTVLLTVAEIGDPQVEALVAALPDLLATRQAGEDQPVIALTTWFRNEQGRVPEPGEIRRYAEALGIDPQTGEIGGHKVAVLRDEARFPGASAAAAVQWAATNIPSEIRARGQVEREVAGRWSLRSTPFFVVIHPGLVTATCGADLERDQILEALLEPLADWELRGIDGADPELRCSLRSVAPEP